MFLLDICVVPFISSMFIDVFDLMCVFLTLWIFFVFVIETRSASQDFITCFRGLSVCSYVFCFPVVLMFRKHLSVVLGLLV